MMERRLIVISASVALMSATAGYALGGYATGGEQSPTQQGDWWGTEASESDTATTPVDTGTAAADGPENYVCKGCGPTLAERRAETSYMPIHDPVDLTYGQEDLTPVPTYHPALAGGGVQDDADERRLPTY